MELGSDFMLGMTVGLMIGTVYCIMIYEQWRRFYNELLKKLYELRDKIKEQNEKQNGSGDI